MWARMKLPKKIGFVFGILGMIIGMVCIVWALPDNLSVALTSVATISFGLMACYFAVRYGEQY